MALTKTEKEIVKSKLNKLKQIIKNTGASEKRTLKEMEDNFMTLNEAYKYVDEEKDKFKGGVPGAADRWFEKEMKQADKFVKETKRVGQEVKYDKKTDEFKRKGPRGDRTKRYSNSVRIIE